MNQQEARVQALRTAAELIDRHCCSNVIDEHPKVRKMLREIETQLHERADRVRENINRKGAADGAGK